jgi:hypothetical protein
MEVEVEMGSGAGRRIGEVGNEGKGGSNRVAHFRTSQFPILPHSFHQRVHLCPRGSREV